VYMLADCCYLSVISQGLTPVLQRMTCMALLGSAPNGKKRFMRLQIQRLKPHWQLQSLVLLRRLSTTAARIVIRDAGYGDYFVNRTGHGLGTEIYEPRYVTASSDTELQEGMVFSIEPGIYLPGRFGLRFKEIVCLHDQGIEVFSELSRDAFGVSASTFVNPDLCTG